MLNEFERLAIKTDAAVFFASHFAKGNSATKNAIDRISGSGVFARDPDTIMMMTENDDQGAKDAFTLSFILRNFKPVEEFVVQWGDWMFFRNDKMDPKKLAQPTQKKKLTEEELLDIVGLKSWIFTTLQSAVSEKGISICKTTFTNLLNKLLSRSRVSKSTDGEYARILTDRDLQKFSPAELDQHAREM